MQGPGKVLRVQKKTTEEECPVEGGEGRAAPESGLHKVIFFPSLPLSPPPSLLFPSSLPHPLVPFLIPLPPRHP